MRLTSSISNQSQQSLARDAMSSQGSAIHTPNNNSDQSFSSGKVDLALYGSPMQIRQNRNVARRTSSFVKMATEDHQEENHPRPARLTRSDARRGSSFIRAMSEDINDDNRYLGKSLSPNVRRESSFLMPGDDSHEDMSKVSKDIRRGSSFIKTTDDSLEEGVAYGRRLDVRRGSSFIRMMSEDINNDEMHSTGRLSGKSDSRRGSGIPKMMSEDINDDLLSRKPLLANIRRGNSISKLMPEDTSEDLSSRRSSAPNMRRGSSFSRMISEENDADVSQTSGKSIDRSDLSDKLGKSRNSLESISEYKTHTFSSAALYPSIEYSAVSMESTSDFSTDFAVQASNASNDDNTDRFFVNSSLSYMSWMESVNSVNSDCVSTTAPLLSEDNRSGEWNNFWTNYNSSRNEYFSSPYLCPSNSGEDLSLDSNGSTQRGYTDKSATDQVILTADEINEAILCTQRLMDILRGAIKRSEPDLVSSKSNEVPNCSKEEQKSSSDDKTVNDKTLFKSSNNSCIDVLLNHTGVADILKRVINKRRDLIMPPDETSSTSRSSLSEWSISKKS